MTALLDSARVSRACDGVLAIAGFSHLFNSQSVVTQSGRLFRPELRNQRARRVPYPAHHDGRGAGLGRPRGVTAGLPVGVGLGVAVGVSVGEGVTLGVGV